MRTFEHINFDLWIHVYLKTKDGFKISIIPYTSHIGQHFGSPLSELFCDIDKSMYAYHKIHNE